MMGRPKLVPIQAGDGDPKHGTVTGYGVCKCRCDLCREANRLKGQKYPRPLRGRVRGRSRFEIPPAQLSRHCPECQPVERCYFHKKVEAGLIT